MKISINKEINNKIDKEIDNIINLNKKFDLIKSIIDNKNINYEINYEINFNKIFDYFNVKFNNLDNECPICYNKKISNDYNKLNCNHFLCEECYHLWKKNCLNNKIIFNCPICRRFI